MQTEKLCSATDFIAGWYCLYVLGHGTCSQDMTIRMKSSIMWFVLVDIHVIQLMAGKYLLITSAAPVILPEFIICLLSFHVLLKVILLAWVLITNIISTVKLAW